MNGFRATILLMLSIALPVGAVASCGGVNCASPAYQRVPARLVAMHGAVATFRAVAVEPGSSVEVGQTFDVRYPTRDAKEFRTGEIYRVETTLDRDNGVVSSLASPCGPNTTFLNGSKVVARTWWQRNHLALGIVVAASVATAGAAMWFRRRSRARGGIGRLAA
jgi:hypothetical protein